MIGELLCRLVEEKSLYAIPVAILGIMIMVSIRDECGIKKSTDLVLFLCLIFGWMWGYGFYHSRLVLNEGDKIKGEMYLYGVEETESRTRLLVKCSNERMLIYIKKENQEAESGRNKQEAESGRNKQEAESGRENQEIQSRKEKKEFEPGEYILVEGTVGTIEGGTNPGAFDMEEYYDGKGIRYSIEPELIKNTGKKNYLVNGLYKFRCMLAERIENVFSEEASSILKTMILGDKTNLNSEVKRLYQRSGIAHILAISGLHVALIAGAIGFFLRLVRVRKSVAEIIIIIAVYMFGLMTGFSPATLRAVIMITVSKIAFLVKRTPDVPTTMMEALIIMVVINPYCITSTGTLMSFMAVMGIWTGEVYYNLIFERERFLMLPERMRGMMKSLVSSVMISLGINLWMIPLIIRSYYEVPIISMFLNFLVIPLLTVVIVTAVIAIVINPFIELLISFITPVGNTGTNIDLNIFRWVCEFILKLYKDMCEFFLKIPGSVIITGHMEVWEMILVYSFLGCLVYGLYSYIKYRRSWIGFVKHKRKVLKSGEGSKTHGAKPKKERKRLIGGTENRRIIEVRKRFRGMLVYMAGCVLFITTLISVTRMINQRRMEVVFLDVGQGDGSIIHSAAGNFIVDGGSSSNETVGQYSLIPALKYYGMSNIDCIFISHMDSDHMNAIAYLLENRKLYGIKIGNVAVAEGTLDNENFRRIKSAVNGEETGKRIQGKENQGKTKQGKKKQSSDEKIQLLELSKGDRVQGTFQVLYPGVDEPVEHEGNDYSLVIKYSNDKMDILYTGDIGIEVEKRLLERGVENLSDRMTESSAENLGDGKTTILKCPHHGSKYSGSEELLEAYNPDITVISCGKHNMYGHPSPETLERLEASGCKIFRTDQDGAVVIRMR